MDWKLSSTFKMAPWPEPLWVVEKIPGAVGLRVTGTELPAAPGVVTVPRWIPVVGTAVSALFLAIEFGQLW